MAAIAQNLRRLAKWTLYIGNTVMLQGISPFHDEKGHTFPRFLMFSANVDHDGDRYGFVRNR
ncbi:MAG TPA: hypothetical protein VI077_03190 [Pseudolabrys sp.]